MIILVLIFTYLMGLGILLEAEGITRKTLIIFFILSPIIVPIYLGRHLASQDKK